MEKQNKGFKVTLTVFFALVAAMLAANFITDIFKSEFKTYFKVD